MTSVLKSKCQIKKQNASLYLCMCIFLLEAPIQVLARKKNKVSDKDTQTHKIEAEIINLYYTI